MRACDQGAVVTFEMRIEEVFRLSNGRTMFAGMISGHAGLIGPCECELRDDQCTRQVIQCEGEPVVKKLDPFNQRRSIATTQEVALSSEEARSGKWKLICAT
jgi:hypothetical protein